MTSTHKKKVLHVTGAMNRAGTETMLMNLYRNIDSANIQFDFVSYDENPAHYDQEIEELNGKVIRLTKTNSVFQLYRTIKQHGPYDAVHAHTLFHSGIVSIASYLAGIKIRVAHAHTTSDSAKGIIGKLYMEMMRLCILIFSTNLLACSHEAGQYLFGKSKQMKKKYTYFPNTIDYSKFLHVPKSEIEKFKMQYGLKNKMVIGHIGTFKESKNHLFLLEILEQLVKEGLNIHLLLVGDGELKSSIQDKAKKKQLTDHITFINNSDDIPIILHSMDVFVFPSIFEGLGLVLLEAQASGIPCIVSEAIQPEADLQLDLIQRIPLKEGSKAWAMKIVQVKDKKEGNIHKITHGFEQQGYALHEGIERLYSLYNFHGGSVHE